MSGVTTPPPRIIDGSTFGGMLRRIRGERSRREFAQAVGVDTSTVRRWEAGETFPQPEHRSLLYKNLTEEERVLLRQGLAPLKPDEQERFREGPGLREGDARSYEMLLQALQGSAPSGAARFAADLAAKDAEELHQMGLEALLYAAQCQLALGKKLGPKR